MNTNHDYSPPPPTDADAPPAEQAQAAPHGWEDVLPDPPEEVDFFETVAPEDIDNWLDSVSEQPRETYEEHLKAKKFDAFFTACREAGLPCAYPLGMQLAFSHELAPEIISGVLRKGHKMLISGASKAGKTWLLLQLATAISRGSKWLGRFQCAKGPVFYMNMELSENSCLDRLVRVQEALGFNPKENSRNLVPWHLRGKSAPLEAYIPFIEQAAKYYEFSAIIIDPIYKVLEADENSAREMAKFCNALDRITEETGAAVIYCHHHSKGAQGDKKAIDRASGSGVFGRDPDAILDLVELQIPPEKKCIAAEAFGVEVDKLLDDRSAWRLSAVLREFRTPDPVDIWFEFPIHKVDTTGVLAEASPAMLYPWNLRKSTELEREDNRRDALRSAVHRVEDAGRATTLENVAQAASVSVSTLRRWVDDSTEFYAYGGEVLSRAEAEDRGIDILLTESENKKLLQAREAEVKLLNYLGTTESVTLWKAKQLTGLRQRTISEIVERSKTLAEKDGKIIKIGEFARRLQ